MNTVPTRQLPLTHNMKSFVAVLALVALAAADVSHIVRSPEADAQIVEQRSDVGPEGFQYSSKTSNGISNEASGALKVVGQEAAVAVSGVDQYTGPDGTIYRTEYIADETGYHPRGDHLPTPPPPQPIPDYILRSLEYIAAHPQPEPLRRA